MSTMPGSTKPTVTAGRLGSTGAGDGPGQSVLKITQIRWTQRGPICWSTSAIDPFLKIKYAITEDEPVTAGVIMEGSPPVVVVLIHGGQVGAWVWESVRSRLTLPSIAV